ncbi:BURP domain [Dillenia turbinata]|uniref:BURP domain n=1 Tax=Dillenia turbinata TaxID=194707 RepID=A0AAN8ZP53_9MAGN
MELRGETVENKAVGVNVGHGGVSVDVGGSGGHRRPPYVRVDPPYVDVQPWAPFGYRYAASEDQLHDNPNVALFFLKKDLQTNTIIDLQFTKASTKNKFLPRHVAETIPFSLNKFDEILQQFSIKSQSAEAETMKKTIKHCEEPATEGEVKYCVTSLEAMVDFSTSKLGKNVQATSTEVDKEESQPQKFTMMPGIKKFAEEKVVVCHSQSYVYPVFYCHETHTTRAYLVLLVGADGTKAKAVAVCHTNTSKWNPKHLAFQVLKVKPGTVPICHFLPENHIVWAAKYEAHTQWKT